MKYVLLYIILPMIAGAMILACANMFGDINLKDDLGEPGAHTTNLIDPGCHGPE